MLVSLDGLWSRQLSSDHLERVQAVAPRIGGGVAVAGYSFGHLDAGGGALQHTDYGDRDGFVAVLDAAGNHVLSRLFGSSGYGEADAVASTPSGDVVVGGGYAGLTDFGDGVQLPRAGNLRDAFIVRYSSTGTHLWTTAIPGLGNAFTKALAVDNNGAIYAAGYFSGTA